MYGVPYKIEDYYSSCFIGKTETASGRAPTMLTSIREKRTEGGRETREHPADFRGWSIVCTTASKLYGVGHDYKAHYGRNA